MAKLIDAMRIDFDDVDITGCTDVDDIIWAVEKLIDAQPAVDAVEVVRCKDCKFFDPNEDVMPQSGSCAYHEMIKMDWDFCSRAKKDGDGNG